jgi:glucose/arabinose dehydrogenase
MRTMVRLSVSCVVFGGAFLLATACGGDDSSGAGNTGGTDGGKGGSGGANGGSGGASGGSGGATGGSGGGVAGGGGSGGGAAGSGGTGGTPSLFDCTPASGSAPSLTLTSIANGFTRPLLAESPPGDPTRLIVAEQAGVITMMVNGTAQPTPFLDISDHVNSGGNEQGLLGVAFHPNFASNGKVYVHYTADGTTAPSGDAMVAEFTVMAGNADVLDASSEKQILTQDEPESNHNGGGLNFGPDGMLYLGLGDGGGGGDQHGSIGNGQSTNTLLGKILRIDVDNPGGGNAYGIPSGNMTGSGVSPELWSYGLRNPWRWSFDACTGDMYIGDVGQNTYEEVDVEPAGTGSGTNYGWRVMEGTHCYNAGTCDMSGKQLPVVDYDHGSGCSVTGGYVYRGHAIPGLKGTYIYADYCSGRFWTFEYASGAASNQQEITSTINPGTSVKNISSFGQDANGELYVMAFDGNVYRIDAQ